LTIGAAVLDQLGTRLPFTRRQVDDQWLQRYRGWVYGAGFGAQLGAGVTTIVTSTSTPVALVLAALTGSPLWGALVMGAFGVVRGASVLAARGVDHPDQLRRLHRRVVELAPVVRSATVIGLALLAVVAAAGALASPAMV
jgi:hypothetical protein